MSFTAQDMPCREHSLECVREGDLDGFAFWWQMHLDEDHLVTNQPGPSRLHWAQTVFLLPPHIRRRVQQGQQLNVEAYVTDTKPDHFPSRLRRHRVAFRLEDNPQAHHLPLLSTPTRLAAINSEVVQSVRLSSLECLTNVCLSIDGWDVAPLVAAISQVSSMKKVRICHPPQDENEDAFDELLATCGRSGRPRINIIPGGERESLRALLGAESDPSFDGCLISLVSPESGLIRWGRLGDLAHLQTQIACVEPKRLSLRACLLDCDALEAQTKVSGAAVFGLDLTAMEPYEPKEIAIDIDEHHHVMLSEFTILDEITDRNIDSDMTLIVSKPGCLNCVLVWFVEHWSGGDITYGPGSLHGAQRAIILAPRQVEPEERLQINVSIIDGTLMVTPLDRI